MIFTAIFFVALSSILILGFITPIIKQTKITSDLWNTKNTFFMSESGVNDVVYRLKGGFTVNSSESLPLLNGSDSDSVLTSIIDNPDGSKTITTTADMGGYVRKTQASIKEGSGVSFSYGIQAGQGGIIFNNSGTVNGNVYSGGDIISYNSSAKINGTAIVAREPNLFIAEQNLASSSPPNSIIFNKTNEAQYVAQSFVVSTSSPLVQTNIFIKKVGWPQEVFVKIIKDSSGSPSGNLEDIILSVKIDATLITTSYSWIEVPFDTNPKLIVGNRYWIALGTSTNSSNYFITAANLDNSYMNGTAKTGNIGGSWNDTNYDSYFKIFLGENFGKIKGYERWNQFHISGGAWAPSLNYVNSDGFMKCQIGSMPNNNKNCDDTYIDPAPADFPISDTNISDWEAEALVGGIRNSSYTLSDDETGSLGPKKIVGNLNLSNSAILTVTGTLWVTGNITLEGNAKLKLSSSYGSNSGVIVTDGKVTIPNSCSVSGSGVSGGYIILVSNSTCDSSNCNGLYAIDVSGDSGSVVLNAQKGTIHLIGSSKVNEATANKIVIDGNNIIDYESGLINPNFVNGPSGSFNVTSWKELEN